MMDDVAVCSRAPSTPFALLLALAMSAGCATAERAPAPPDRDLVYLPQVLEVELARAAAPAHLRTEATVYVFDSTGYQRTHNGTNGMTCLVNRDGHQDGGNELRPTCWDAEGSATIVPVMLRVGELIAQGAAAAEIARDIDIGFELGHFTSPRKAGIAYMLRGDVIFDEATQEVARTIFPPHYMIYAPGLSNADIGTTDEAYASDPTLPLVYDGYAGGTRTAYIIVLAAESVDHAAP